MKNKLPKSYFFTEEDLPLIQVSHSYMQSSAWFGEGMSNQMATFDLVVRELPNNRNFLVFGGLEEIIYWLSKIKFSKDDIDFLLKNKLITKQFSKYLKNFKFTGSVYALPEGTIFFPGEPVIRVVAPLIEASLIETYLLTAGSSNIMFFSKAARLRLATPEKMIGTAPFRAHSFESGAKACRAAYCFGIVSTGTPAIYKKYGFKTPDYYIINGQHMFIKSFPNELEAFRTLIKYSPGNSGFMIDTYNFESGIINAITVAKELKVKGKSLGYICIDSGDLAERVKYARRRLDQGGFKKVKIIIVSNLDEYKLADLVKRKIPFDIAFPVTEYTTLFDSPKLEIVYKLAETREGNNIHYTAKLATGKISYPGRKQVFRKFDKKGVIMGDTIALEGEKVDGVPLLKEVMKNGKVVKKLPNIEQLKKYTLNQLKTLPDYLKILEESKKSYPVKISDKIESLLADLKRKHGHDQD